MPSVAITGTIGSGKSELLHLLGKGLATFIPTSIFSADDENRKLLDANPEVREAIIQKLGKDCYQPDGKADRTRLFSMISIDAQARSTLEGIMHPKIESLWRPKAEKHATSTTSFFIAEIPLLFEKGLESYFSKSIVVGCSDSIRKERLMRRSLTPEKAEGWMNLQESQQSKVTKSDYMIWNDGSLEALKNQTSLLASSLLKQ
jgi:dephospho-CoA kinase